jgi:hypothetical protein
MKLSLSLEDAAILKVMLEDEQTKQNYAKLVSIYMEQNQCDENEAKSILGPFWIQSLLDMGRKQLHQGEVKK